MDQIILWINKELSSSPRIPAASCRRFNSAADVQNIAPGHPPNRCRTDTTAAAAAAAAVAAAEHRLQAAVCCSVGPDGVPALVFRDPCATVVRVKNSFAAA